METKIMLVSPEQAQSWLDNQVTNRPIRWPWVRQIARTMMAGLWPTETNETIGIDYDGRLRDGQHRLLAVIMTKTPIRLAVTFGIKTHVGCAANRSAVDIARINYHIDFDSIKSGIVRSLYLRIEHSKFTMNANEIIEIYQGYQDGIDFAASILGCKPRVSVAIVGAIYTRAYYHEETERIREFSQVLQSGNPQSAEDWAAQRLRELLLGMPSVSGRSVRTDVYRKAQAAMRHFCARTPLTRLYQNTEEIYELPVINTVSQMTFDTLPSLQEKMATT